MTGIDLDDIRRVKPSGLQHAGSALSRGARDLTVQHWHYVQTTNYPVAGGHAWTGHGRAHAQGVTDATANAIDGVHLRLGPAAVVLTGLANYLTSAQRKLDGIDRSARNLHAEIDGMAVATLHPVHGETKVDKTTREAAVSVLVQEARALLVVTNGMDNTAARALRQLGHGNLTTPPSGKVVDRAFWTQSFDKPSFWQDMISAIKDLAIPPTDKGMVAFGLWSLSHNLTFGTTLADWAGKLKYAHVDPRDGGGFLVRKDAPWLKKVWWAAHDRKWSANPGAESDWKAWQKSFGKLSKAAGRGGSVLSFAGSVWDQWSRDSHRADLSTGDKVERAVYRGSVVLGSGWAGAEAGAAIGTAIEPGGGTVVGGVLGFVGGVGGAALGNWYVDQTLDHTSHAHYEPRYYDPSHPGNAPGAL